ncbi:MAG: TrkA family potassium uptake protein [Gemmatimonadota bacterium]|jgi:trk system potassium uptake protein TrkA
MKRFVIIGLGNFGAGVAETLFARGHEVVAIDTDEHAVDRIASHVSRAAVGDGRDRSVLEEIGARQANAGVISTGDDLTASILSMLALKDLEVDEIYVKVISTDHARIMEKLGATETIFPERESAVRLGTRITSHAILNYVRLGPGFSIQEMAVPEQWIGKSMRDLELRRLHNITVIAVHDVLLDRMMPVPDPDAPLKDSDTLLIAGADADLEYASKIGLE